MTDLARIQPPAMGIAKFDTANPIGAMLHAVTEKGITAESVAAVEKLCDLYLKMEQEGAKKQFAAAFRAAQADIPKIVAMRIIPKKDGSYRSSFANFEDLMDAIQPPLDAHGLSISFDSEQTQTGVLAICIVTHIAGHSERRRFHARTSVPPETTPGQADIATLSLAKRAVLCATFNIPITHDRDARLDGDYITKEQAAALQARVEATGSDTARFLKVAGATEFGKIRAGKYAMLDNVLMRKERAL